MAIAMAIIVWLSADEGGFQATASLPATLLLLGLLLVGILALPTPRPTPAVRLAIGLLCAYAAWSYLSIVWADQQGLAWAAANRTAMYAIALPLFALWPTSGRVGASLAGTYSVAIAVIGLDQLLRANGAADPGAFFLQGRLNAPTGYANANVALWMSAFWPAVLLACRRPVPIALRALLLASAGLLASLAMLGQSRAWVIVLPVMILVVIATVPGRGRTVGALALVAVTVAALSGPLLAVYEGTLHPALHVDPLPGAIGAIAAVCAILGSAGAVWGFADQRLQVRSPVRNRVNTAVIVGFVVCCLVGVGAFTVARGNPLTRASSAWNEFKRGGDEPTFHQARLGSLGGTNRYDFWRVAWRDFTENPILGVGADNFGREYLRYGATRETPTYPHSIELRTLSETGIVGFLILLGSLCAAILVAARALRSPDRFASTTAGIGLVVFAYFVVHGSVDWFWEFPALGGAAFALLGLATAVAARPLTGPMTGPGRLTIALVGIGVAVLTAALTFPWLAERELQGARAIAAENPGAALAKLSRAADLNPLSPSPDETAGMIERQDGSLGGAESDFRQALDRDPGNPFATLQLALLASVRGHNAQALRLIEQARLVNPRDPVTRRVQRLMEKGVRVDPATVDRWILRDIAERTGTK
ncbi:MAG TPA: O-antigen ligase family protein [Solirubrobacterales bacterium]|nr:O-antigen ligase family protein [Solirubrobacterales bacterium]